MEQVVRFLKAGLLVALLGMMGGCVTAYKFDTSKPSAKVRFLLEKKNKAGLFNIPLNVYIFDSEDCDNPRLMGRLKAKKGAPGILDVEVEVNKPFVFMLFDTTTHSFEFSTFVFSPQESMNYEIVTQPYGSARVFKNINEERVADLTQRRPARACRI